MNPVKIFTDSTASLSKELLDKYNISVIPLYVVFDGQSFKDGAEIDEQKLYKLIDEKQILPTTSAPTPLDYKAAFSPWIEDGYDIIYIGLSSRLSSAVQNAAIAANEFMEGRVRIIDSLNLSSGIGLLVLEAAECKLSGMDSKNIYEHVCKFVPRIRSSFVIDSLKYLYMGGRCSSLEKSLSSILKIHPRIVVSDGSMSVGQKFMGNRKTILKGLIRSIELKKDSVEPHRIFITHSCCSKEEIEFIKKEVKSLISAQEILVTDAGCVIATHCGPKTVGILYVEKP